MLYLTSAGIAQTQAKPLAPCSGRRDEGWTQCAEGCVGHIDQFASNDEPGCANAILASLPHVAGAELVGEWTWDSHPCMREEKWIRLVRHPTLFVSGNDVAVPIWVLLVVDHQSGERDFALAFTDAQRAQAAMDDEVEQAEDWCDCESATPREESAAG